jgi:hypothetical protein
VISGSGLRTSASGPVRADLKVGLYEHDYEHDEAPRTLYVEADL